jgi:hypothetical protein
MICAIITGMAMAYKKLTEIRVSDLTYHFNLVRIAYTSTMCPAIEISTNNHLIEHVWPQSRKAETIKALIFLNDEEGTRIKAAPTPRQQVAMVNGIISARAADVFAAQIDRYDGVHEVRADGCACNIAASGHVLQPVKKRP